MLQGCDRLVTGVITLLYKQLCDKLITTLYIVKNLVTTLYNLASFVQVLINIEGKDMTRRRHVKQMRTNLVISLPIMYIEQFQL